jgi:hypothetical protein
MSTASSLSTSIAESRRPFLTATWRYLLNVTYRVPPEVLQSHLPPGLTLDVRQGSAFASIVAFHFRDTRVRGLLIPGHVHFPEINLRYYVKWGDRRGVVFLKELVPRYCIALVANRLYNEPYEATSMSVNLTPDGEDQRLTHRFRYGQRWHHIHARFGPELHLPADNSEAYYFQEHDIGFGVTHGGQTLSYDVKHPHWRNYALKDHHLDLDFGQLYGPEWSFLSEAEPHCATIAEGSAVKVYGKVAVNP